MVGLFLQKLVLAVSYAGLVCSLPGRQNQALKHCPDSGYVNGAKCQIPSTPSHVHAEALITPAPTLAMNLARRGPLYTSIKCDEDGRCSVFDFSSSLITVVDVSELLTPTARADISATGTGNSTSLIATSASFTNATVTGTGSASIPSSFNISISTLDNSTTQITSTLTLSVTTITDPPWNSWASNPTASSNSSASASSGAHNNATWTNTLATNTSDSTTSMTAVPHPTGFNSTLSYVFEGTTYVIPVPDSYRSTIPSISPSTTASVQDSSLPVLSSTASYTTCYTSSKYTTTSNFVSGTFVTAYPDSRVCYGLECSGLSCSEFAINYPIAANGSTTSSTPATSSPSSRPLLSPAAASTNADTVVDGQITSSLVFTDSTGATLTTLFTFPPVSASTSTTSTPGNVWNPWAQTVTATSSPSSTTSTRVIRVRVPAVQHLNTGYNRRTELVKARKEDGAKDQPK